MKLLNKGLIFSDLHIGRKSDSIVHNTDCLNYINWLVKTAKENKIDHIIFGGDWYEHRNSVNGRTLKYSYDCAKLLNDVGVPVYFITGNHDLFHRNNRDIFTTYPFEALENFHIISKEPEIIEAVSGGLLVCPFLFPTEYVTYAHMINSATVVVGHFEFNGFILTGEHKKAEHGATHTIFDKPKRIFSGHFHRRQTKDNVHYIGNCFPMDFSDANDSARGVAIYQYDIDKLDFVDWGDCPMYVNCKLSDVMDEPEKYLIANARVKCLVDLEINFEESNALKEQFMRKYKLREVSLEDTTELNDILEDTDISLEGMELETTENIIKEMLRQIKSEKISNDKLIKIYEGLNES